MEKILNVQSEKTIVLIAREWEIKHSSDKTTFSINDDFTKLIDEFGPGVYTILLWTTPTGSETAIAITTISIFV